MYFGKAVTVKPKKIENLGLSHFISPKNVFSNGHLVLGSGPDRGWSPVEWGYFPFVVLPS